MKGFLKIIVLYFVIFGPLFYMKSHGITVTDEEMRGWGIMIVGLLAVGLFILAILMPWYVYRAAQDLRKMLNNLRDIKQASLESAKYLHHILNDLEETRGITGVTPKEKPPAWKE